ncbi:MAG: hypothetical protein CMC96_07095 [Flavobacteriales bacterium]|nr:hypothetical protein [Flavobacteriales bacterium]|tara:strand:- start:12764 stop:13144 length:381 start_codon:yes stop_codon:yes gene_type:complete
MKTKTKIKDLHSLKIAKAELTAEVSYREVNMQIKAQELKESLFDFNKFKKQTTDSLLDFLDENFNLGASSLSNLIIKYIIRPKNKWVRRLSMAASNFAIKKYSSLIKSAIKVLLGTEEERKALKNE